jgi:TPR repeat protein
MKKILLGMTLAMAVQMPAVAGYKEGIAAYTAKNYVVAMRELKPLAKAGLTDAQYMVGLMYYTGRGVPQDYRQSAAWQQIAAGKGKADAQYILGSMYYTGQGVPQDYALAVSWFRKAAEQGHAEAQYLLGLMYRHHAGGMPRDLVIAYMLWNLAAASGSSNAFDQRTALVKHMNKAQIEEGQALSSAWRVGMALPASSKTGADGE